MTSCKAIDAYCGEAAERRETVREDERSKSSAPGSARVMASGGR